MPVDQIGIFVLLIQAFKDVLDTTIADLYPWVFLVFGVLGGLEIVRVIWVMALDKRPVLPLVVPVVIKLVVLTYVIARWEYVFHTATKLGADLGLRATHYTMTMAQFLNPGYYWHMGLTIGEILFQQWNRSAIATMTQIITSPFVTAGYFLAWLFFLIAFAVIALTVFWIQIKLAFAYPATLVLLPCLVFDKTAWLAKGIVMFLASVSYHFFFLALTASVVMPIAARIVFTAEPSLHQAIMFDIAAVTMVACFWGVPKLAQEILRGIFTMGAGSLAEAAFLAQTSLQSLGATVKLLGGAIAGGLAGLGGGLAGLGGGRLPSFGGSGTPSAAGGMSSAMTPSVSGVPAAAPMMSTVSAQVLRSYLAQGGQYLLPPTSGPRRLNP